MSNLLEQAIIDAAALREVALKNAESALIEKYSKEFKESVQKLLEQEETAPAPVDPVASADPLATDPLAAGGMDSEKEKAFEKVKSSFLEGDEDEVITIDFDELKKQISKSVGGASPMLASPSAAPAPESATPAEAPAATPAPEAAPAAPLAENLEEEYVDEDLEEEFELEEADEKGANESIHTNALDEEQEELEETAAQEDMLVEPDKKKKKTLKKQKTLENIEEDIQISEEELKELEEQLKVDISAENLSDGHMGSTVKDKREQRALEFAEARDEKEKEAREEEKEKMADLEEKLSEAIDVGTSLVEENEELKEKLSEMAEYLTSLRENVEKLSISNAKLLYTNKVFGNSSLNERQKQQIVETISNATSVLEAKTIYNTLQSTVSGVTQSKPKESLSEAINRGNSPFLTRKQPTADLSFADRMKKLAGIS